MVRIPRRSRPPHGAKPKVPGPRVPALRAPVPFSDPDDLAQVALRVFGADLDPAEITLLLGAAPTEAARTGTVFVGQGGEPRTVRKGYWRLDTAQSQQTVEEQARVLLAALTQDLEVWRSLTARYEADLFCGLFLEGFNLVSSLPPDLLRALADRGLALRFDIYAV